MNRFVARLTPGSPEARRSYCSCTGETQTAVRENGETQTTYVIDPDCKLHGGREVDRLQGGLF